MLQVSLLSSLFCPSMFLGKLPFRVYSTRLPAFQIGGLELTSEGFQKKIKDKRLRGQVLIPLLPLCLHRDLAVAMFPCSHPPNGCMPSKAHMSLSLHASLNLVNKVSPLKGPFAKHSLVKPPWV
jgi:hypothetical protein